MITKQMARPAREYEVPEIFKHAPDMRKFQCYAMMNGVALGDTAPCVVIVDETSQMNKTLDRLARNTDDIIWLNGGHIKFLLSLYPRARVYGSSAQLNTR